MKNKSNNYCSDVIGKDTSIHKCETFIPNKEYSFKDGCCYENGIYYGKVIFSDEKIIQIEVDNGNRYMNGMIQTFNLLINKQ